MPKGKLTEKLPLSLTAWQHEELRRAARERDMSCAKLIRVALGKYLFEPASPASAAQRQEECRTETMCERDDRKSNAGHSKTSPDRLRPRSRMERMIGRDDSGAFVGLTEEHEREVALDLAPIRYKAEVGLGILADEVPSSATGNIIAVDFSRNVKLKGGD